MKRWFVTVVWSLMLALPLQGLGGCRTWGADGENRPQRADFLPDSPPHSPAMGQEDGEKAAAAADLQPATPKSDSLLAVAVGATAPTVSVDGMHHKAAAVHDGMTTPCHAVDTLASADEASTHAGCSQCAVCHANAAPVPPSAVAPCDSPQAQAPPAWQAPILSAVDPDGLDRPPRRTFV